MRDNLIQLRASNTNDLHVRLVLEIDLGYFLILAILGSHFGYFGRSILAILAIDHCSQHSYFYHPVSQHFVGLFPSSDQTSAVGNTHVYDSCTHSSAESLSTLRPSASQFQ